MGHDGTMVLSVGAAAMVFVMAGYGYLEKRTFEYGNSISSLAMVVDKLEFPDSRTAEGHLDGLSHKDCIKRAII